MLCVNTPVAVTVLGVGSGLARPATITDLAGVRVRIALADALPRGAAVKVETEEILLLAEVCHCAESAAARFEALLIASEMLIGLTKLRRLNKALLEEPAR